MPNRLITISASHYCEKARWALDLAGVDYVEDAHVSGFHKRVVRAVGGAGSVPVLVTEDGLLRDSDAIVLWAAERARPRLLPDDPVARQTALDWLKYFNEDLGEEVRLWFFGAVIDLNRILRKLASSAVPLRERLLLPLFLPLAKKMIHKKRDLSARRIELAGQRISATLDQVARAIETGAGFLAGDRLSLADIGFASLSSLALLPAGFGAWLPTPEQLPGPAASQVMRWRNHPAGIYALDLYRRYRSPG